MRIAQSISISRTVIVAVCTMLCAGLALVPLGCASNPTGTPITATKTEKKLFAQPSLGVQVPPEYTRDTDSGAVTESPEQAIARAPRPTPPPAPIDPGAEKVVEHLVRVLKASTQREIEAITIGVSRLRNQSRCSDEEFQAMLQRLAAQFTHAGKRHNITFTSDMTAQIAYELRGAAYLVTAEGFDLWETFLALTPADSTWTLWTAPGPVNILRQMRPNQPQILLGLQW